MLSSLVERLSGKSLFDFLNERIFSHLGTFQTATILKTPNGDSWGDSALVCTPRDMLSFARLLMNGGMWEGKQLIPADYIKEATSPIVDNDEDGWPTALQHGYGIELDIHLLKDGNLAVIHDSLLNRTTGLPGRIEDLTTEQLKDYRLEGTDETIPEFMDVLTLYNGKAPLIVELKVSGNNYAKLTETACRMLDSYKGVYCLESFDPRCLLWLKKNRPDIIRGQLTENYLGNIL